MYQSLCELFGQDVGLFSQRSSTFADIYGVSTEGSGTFVAKRIKTKLCGIGSEADLNRVFDVTAHFEAGLRQLKVPTPRFFKTAVLRTRSGEIEGWLISSHEGHDLGGIDREFSGKRERTLVRIVNSISGVLGQEESAVGLDPRLHNFTTFAGRVCYVDVFPPLCHFNGIPYVHLPNPVSPPVVAKELERKFRPEGILRRLRFELIARDPSLHELLVKVVGEVLVSSNFCAHWVAYLSSLPDNRLNGNSRNQAAVMKLVDEYIERRGVDELREIAARILPRNYCREELMTRVFRLTSSFPAEGYPIEHADRLGLFREMMDQQLSS